MADDSFVVWEGHTTIFGGVIKGSRRSVAWLEFIDQECHKKGLVFRVIQSAYNTGVDASAGTHDFDACYDVFIEGLDWPEMQRFLRARGGGAWWRRPEQGFSNHIHVIVLPEPRGSHDFTKRVGILVPQQVIDYYNHALGLSSSVGGHNPGSDPSWHPDPQPIFDHEKFLREDDDMQFNDKIPGTDVTVAAYMRQGLRSAKAISGIRSTVNEIDRELDALADENATREQVKRAATNLRTQLNQVKAKLASLEVDEDDHAPTDGKKAEALAAADDVGPGPE